jgi:hypothetical protein
LVTAVAVVAVALLSDVVGLAVVVMLDQLAVQQQAVCLEVLILVVAVVDQTGLETQALVARAS